MGCPMYGSGVDGWDGWTDARKMVGKNRPLIPYAHFPIFNSYILILGLETEWRQRIYMFDHVEEV